MDVRMYTVGPVQENCFFAVGDGGKGFIVDPGDQGAELLGEVEKLGLDVEAILLTHTHFDHVGAVAEVARGTGAPVYCPELEKHILADINAHMRFPGLGPFESYDADETYAGGETLHIAGFDIDVIFVPGHSIGHVALSVPAEQVVFSGDVLFQGSIGRTDLPGGDYNVLMQSIQLLLDTLPDETRVCPGHMGPTTLGTERTTNPFLQELV